MSSMLAKGMRYKYESYGALEENVNVIKSRELTGEFTVRHGKIVPLNITAVGKLRLQSERYESTVSLWEVNVPA